MFQILGHLPYTKINFLTLPDLLNSMKFVCFKCEAYNVTVLLFCYRFMTDVKHLDPGCWTRGLNPRQKQSLVFIARTE